MNEKLAVDGGTPVRTRAFPCYWGAAVIGDEELALVTEVIRSRSLFRDYGENKPHMVNDLELEACARFGLKYALAVTSGSAALYCAMVGLGLGPGDEVIMPALAWRSDFQAPLVVGATPVFAEIDRSLGLDPVDFERKITSRTKAVIVIHFQGGVSDMDGILAVAKKHGIAVIEDCAQSAGASYHGEMVGSFGEVAIYSFQQNKLISSGEGGLFACKDPIVFERAVRFHDLGLLRSALKAQLGGIARIPEFSGLQFRMSELTGAVALAQLRNLDRRLLNITRKYHHGLKVSLRNDCHGIQFRSCQDEAGDAGIILYIDMGQPEKGQWFSKALLAEGIQVNGGTRACNILAETWVLERRQVHDALPPFGCGCPGENVRYQSNDCPQTDDIIASMVGVMITSRHTDEDIADIHRAIVKVWKQCKA
jgi:dTDP-4-amino-4,6-dideoxygalactose transaminase